MKSDGADTSLLIGKSLTRVDGYEKVTGAAMYTIDLAFSRMLHAKVKRSTVPHAKIRSVDVSKAVKVPGVRAIITSQDVPDLRRSLMKDTPILAVDKVLYVGQPVAAVAADDVESAEEAVELIGIDYEELPTVFDPERALLANPDAVLHPERIRLLTGKAPFETDPTRPNVAGIFRAIEGDPEKAMSTADLVVENSFSATPTHAFHTESIVTVASVNPDGTVTIWSSYQAPHALRLDVADSLGIAPSRVRVIIPYIGGGFGNKMTPFTDLTAVFLSRKARRPVKLVLSREEAMVASSVRYPFRITVKDGVTREGRILAREITAVANGGAFSLSPNVPRNMVHAAVSTYAIPNIRVDAIRVFTNQVPAGAFRGFGSAQIAWAIESQMDMVAQELGLDPLEFRLRHLLKEGELNAVGEVMEHKNEVDCLRRAAETIGWRNRRIDGDGVWRRGVGLSLTNKISTDPGSTAYVRLRDDGIVEVWTSATEMGQGTYTSLTQLVGEEMGVDLAMIRIVTPDTNFTPFDPGAYSSHTLFSVGNALRIACANLKRQLREKASRMLDVLPENLEVKGGLVIAKDSGHRLRFTDLFSRGLMRYGAVTDAGSDFWGMGTWTVPVSHLDPLTWKVPGGRAGGFYSPAAEAAEVAVNLETGQIKVLRFVTVMNVGKAVNPALVEGQVEGSVAMGISCALAEELRIEGGRVVNPDLKDYKLISSLEASRMTFLPEESPLEEGPFGAKGVAEPAITGVAPAIGNAIYNAVGVRITDLPITREKVLLALRSRQQKQR